MSVPDSPKVMYERTSLVVDPQWQAFAAKVESLQSLEFDWNGQGSEPPNEISRGFAEKVLDGLEKIAFPPNQISPSAEGGVFIAFAKRHRYANIEAFNTGEALALVENADGTPDIWDVTDENLETSLAKIRDYLNS